MKKIFQIGIVLALAALLPTGVLFAGDGDGKGKKNQISVKPTDGMGTSVTVTVNTETVDLNSLHINTRTPGTAIKDISPVLGGVTVTIEMDPETFSSNDGGGIIIIEIVGVDNITGVNATDGNNGTQIPANITAIEEDNSTTGGTTNNTNPNGYHSQPNTTASTNAGGNGGDVGTLTATADKTDINIFPNPVVDHTNVVTVGEILGKTIHIMDLSGRIIFTTRVAEGARQTVLDLSGLTPGVYVIMYNTEDGKTISKKIQKI